MLEFDDVVFLTSRCSAGGDEGGGVSNSASSSSLSDSSPLMMAATANYDTNKYLSNQYFNTVVDTCAECNEVSVDLRSVRVCRDYEMIG